MSLTKSYCEVAISGNQVHLAGQLADDTSVDISAQTQQTLDNIDRLLAEAGTDKTHIFICVYFPERH